MQRVLRPEGGMDHAGIGPQREQVRGGLLRQVLGQGAPLRPGQQEARHRAAILRRATAEEVEQAIAHGAQLLMLPMFTEPHELREFSRIVAGRCGIVPLLETAEALRCIGDWIATPGLYEVFVGLNDLHVSMGLRFMFEPLALGCLDEVAAQARAQGLRFGFGGIAGTAVEIAKLIFFVAIVLFAISAVIGLLRGRTPM